MILIGVFMLNCLLLASFSNVASKAIKQDLEKAIEEENSSKDPSEPIAPSVPKVQ